MEQLYSIIWGAFHGYLLYIIDMPKKENITLEDLKRFFTEGQIKTYLLLIIGFVTLFEAAGYLLCYAYLDFNIIIEVLFYFSLIFSTFTILMVIMGFLLELKNGSLDDNNSQAGAGTFLRCVMKSNLLSIITLSLMLVKTFNK